MLLAPASQSPRQVALRQVCDPHTHALSLGAA